MSKKRLAALVLVLTLFMVNLSSCTTYDNFREAFFGNKGADAGTVKIGILEPQTGNDSEYGSLEIQGIELAHEIAPQVLGKQVELVYADTQSSIYVAETATADLIDKQPAVVLGSYGDAVSLVASQKLGQAGIPAIAMTASNPLITVNNDYYFRVNVTDAGQGSGLADFVAWYLGETNVAVITMKDDDASREMINQFTKELTVAVQTRAEEAKADEETASEEARSKFASDEKDTADATADGATITTIEIDTKDKDYSTYVQELADSGAGAVFMPVSLKTAERFFSQAEKLGLSDVTFIGPEDWHNDELIGIQQKFPSLHIAVAADFSYDVDKEDATSLYRQFLAAYSRKYGEEEDPPEAVALGFDAYMIAIRAMEQAGSTDGDQVREALQVTQGFHGASGEISFNATGEPIKNINVDIVEDGRFVSVYTVK